MPFGLTNALASF
jgi:uncharacterized protein YerC